MNNAKHFLGKKKIVCKKKREKTATDLHQRKDVELVGHGDASNAAWTTSKATRTQQNQTGAAGLTERRRRDVVGGGRTKLGDTRFVFFF